MLDNKVVVERILKVLDDKNMTKSELAEKCGWPIPKMSKMLSNSQRITTDDLITIAWALNYNPALFIANKVSDIVIEEKQVLPLNAIFDKIYNSTDKEILDELFEMELVNTIKNYLSLSESGKSVKAYYRNKKSSRGYVSYPRVVVSDTSEGQLFGEQLKVGYWFDENFRTVSLAISFMRTFSTANDKERISLMSKNDIRELLQKLNVEKNSYENLYENERDNNFDAARLRARNGIIYYIQYDLANIKDEEFYKNDLLKIYNIYLKLLEAATEKVQETFEQLFQVQNKRTGKAHNNETGGEFGITDLNRILAEPIARRQSANIRHKVLEEKGYRCEIDEEHQTFVEGGTGKPYMLVKHLIPLSKQADYNVSLDIIENCCCLCPMCNAKLLHGTDEDRQDMLVKMYGKHKEDLNKVGVSTTLMQLFKYHGMK